MAIKQKCPKCDHRLFLDNTYYGQPERLKCPICGFSVWFAPEVKMPRLEPDHSKFVGNQWTMDCTAPMSKEERRARNLAAQRKHWAKVRGEAICAG